MIRLKNVLVATDFSEPSDAALQYGRGLARTFDGTLKVLHVADHVCTMYGPATYALAIPDLQREIETAVQRQVEGLLTEEDRTALHGRAVIVTAVGKAEAIVSYAQQHAIDVIVMGTHGRGAWGHLFMGSVADCVVRTAACPVLTVHQPTTNSLCRTLSPPSREPKHAPILSVADGG
jgi:nucleotide-binding universal stress UspA family protein